MSITISILNQKGGVAKTTTAINLSSSLGELGHRVLLIDLDPQANSTNAVGIDDEELEKTIHSLFEIIKKSSKKIGSGIVKAHIQHTDFSLDILPSDILLADSEQSLLSSVASQHFLKKVINQVEDDYDYIIIDCPPSLGILTINAMTASNNIIVPLYPAYFSVKGLQQLLNTYEQVRDHLNNELTIMGVVLTKFNKSISKHNEIKDELYTGKAFGDNIFKAVIRTNTEIEKAQDQQTPINFYNKNCNGYEDYLNLAKEVINYG